MWLIGLFLRPARTKPLNIFGSWGLPLGYCFNMLQNVFFQKTSGEAARIQTNFGFVLCVGASLCYHRGYEKVVFKLFGLHLQHRARLKRFYKASPQGRRDEKDNETLNIGPAENLICPCKTPTIQKFKQVTGLLPAPEA